MKYWVYINEKVDGPYDGEKLVTLQGFTPDTLICSEEAASSGNQQWVKASSVFEFEQDPTDADQNGAQNGGLDAASAAMLLEKLDLLTKEITDLHSKLDNMETHIDKAFEESRAQQQAALQAAVVPATVAPATELIKEEPAKTVAPATDADTQETPAPDTQTPQTDETPKEGTNPLDTLDNMETPALADDNVLEEKTSAEEELVIRSALDSLYNAKLLDEQDTKENTFQDLLTPQQAKDLANEADKAKPAETEKTEEEEKAAAETAPAEQPVAETPAANEEPAVEEKDEFIDTFNHSSAQQSESALDQLIKEKQEEEQQKEGADIAPLATAAAVGAAAAVGLASLGGDTEEQKTEEKQEETPFIPLEEEDKSLDLTPQDEVLEIAPNKEEPSQLEEVLPAEKMPQDNPKPDIVQMEQPSDLPSLQEEVLPEIAPEQEPEPFVDTKPSMNGLGDGMDSVPTQEEDENEGTLQELVPGAITEAPSDQIITEEDLRDAFTERIPTPGSEVSPFDEFPSDDVAPAVQTVQTEEAKNPNELTEVELKAGSTYLISDFVPPSQSPADMPEPVKAEPVVEDKTMEIQDMLTATPETATSEDIENTLKTTKRGASFDIKTVPMVQDPAQSERLKIDGFDDVNAQHEVKAADAKSSGSTKFVVGTLATLALVIVLYVLLAFMHIIPQQFNFLFKKPAPAAAVPAAQMQEMLPTTPVATEQEETPAAAEEQQAVEETASGSEADQGAMKDILLEVQQFVLPNGQSLQSLIETKHAGVSPELITWDISTAVDPDNYSVLVKVPPENPQSFKTSYRFNYNAVTKALDPTISDAKNLLESAN